ncbi:response regulator transcription factor [Nocardioides sp. C4-1]|uniref:response regulator transcription factor n=1 Tax=Nocardioides sp. C4-1 TaxID=3151851 RepID=UPI00326753FE
MLTVGVCEDHDTIRGVLVRELRGAGHEVVAAHDGGEALRRFGPESDVQVVVMDIGLPDSDGRDVVQALRTAGQRAPVLFLTALGQVSDKLQAFAVGADDYVVKPFEMPEVLARVSALAARGGVVGPRVGTLVLDPVAHAARCGSAEVLLTPTEFRMLAAIVARPGDVVRRRAVVAAAWPDGSIVNENTIDTYVRRLRTKLSSIGAPERIETVRGVGFRAVGTDGATS